MNKCIIIGNLAKDPEARKTKSGTACTTFTVAVTRAFSKEKEADFLPVVTFRTVAENCAKYLAKGRKVCVEGSVQTRSYEAQDGSKRYVTEIIADAVEFLTPSEKGSKPPEADGYTETDEQMPF